MLHHVVFFSTREGCEADALFEGLKILEQIPLSEPVQILRNLHEDTLSREVEFVVFGRFRDAQELATYKAHPLYAESIRRARPLRELRVAADFTPVACGPASPDSPPAR